MLSLIQSKATLILSIIAFLIISAVASYIFILKSNLAIANETIIAREETIQRQKFQIDGFIISINNQNEAISKLEVKTSEAIATIATQTPKIIEKYSTIKVKDETCESKLKAINEVFSIFNGGNQ